MQKQVNFFEQNVQWFAVGLGGLFLAWMLYAYVLATPVSVKVGNVESVPPGEVDKMTLEGPVAELKREIARSEVPNIPQEQYVEAFKTAIHGSAGQSVLLAASQIRSAPMLPPGTPTEIGPEGEIKLVGPAKAVTVLPALPVAKVGSHTEGRSYISYEDPNFLPNPAKPNAVPEVFYADKDWWSGEFVIDGTELYQAFAKAFDVKKIEQVFPDATPFFQTALVDVQLIRQEIGAGNRVVKEEVVKPLANQPVTVRPPYPPADADPAVVGTYLNTVTQNQIELQSPPFYTVEAGDPWREPGEATDLELAALKQAGKEERKRLKEEQRQKLQAAQATRAGRSARGVGVGGGLEEGMMDDPTMDLPVAGVGRVPPRRFTPSAPLPGRPTVRPGLPGRPGVRQPAVPIGPVVLGTGKFSVVEGMGQIRIIAHDDTVEPGKTYRYKLRYKLFNPTYRGTAAPPELTKVFALESPKESPWTALFTIRPKVEFFLASANRTGAAFDTFTFTKGIMKKSSTSTLAPGDVIGGTGWSLVDTGGSGDKAYALLMDERGQVVRREPKADKESDRYDELNFEATQPPAIGLGQ